MLYYGYQIGTPHTKPKSPLESPLWDPWSPFSYKYPKGHNLWTLSFLALPSPLSAFLSLIFLLETLHLQFPTKSSHLTLGFLIHHPKSALPTTITAPVTPVYGNTFLVQYYSWSPCILLDPFPRSTYWLDHRNSFGWHSTGIKDFTITVWFLCLAGQIGCRWLKKSRDIQL